MSGQFNLVPKLIAFHFFFGGAFLAENFGLSRIRHDYFTANIFLFVCCHHFYAVHLSVCTYIFGVVKYLKVQNEVET